MRSTALTATLVVAVGCSSGPKDERLHLRIAVVGAVHPLAPLGETASALAQDWVFEALAGVNDAGELIPRLASRIERLDGGRYRVQIRAGATFSDGAAVRDEDIAASFKETALTVIRDGLWLVVIPARPDARADVQLVRTLVARRAASGWLGTGPFAVVDQSARSMLLKRLSPIARKIESIELKSFDSLDDAFARTLAGEADVLPGVPPRMSEFFDGVPQLKVLRGPGLNAEAVLFNPISMGRELRSALRRELPQTDVLEVAARDGCVPMQARTPNPDLEPLPEGPPLRIVALVQDGTAQRIGLALRRWLGTRSYKLTLLDVTQLASTLGSGAYDLWLARPLMQPRGMMAEFFHGGAANNFTQYANSEADAAFDANDWSAVDAAFAKDPPGVYLCVPERIAAVDSRFKNARLGPYGLFETLPEWEVSP